jgi:hypothetical protein
MREELACNNLDGETPMSWRKAFLTVGAVALTAVSLAPTASARVRVKVVRIIPAFVLDQGLTEADFCGGRFPAYGVDACGYREVSYGPNSCWRRLPYRPDVPEARRVWVCG